MTTARSFANELTGVESLRQRLGDALRFRRGSVPGARDYGSNLLDVIDRNQDAELSPRAARAVADAISNPANGLQDVTLERVFWQADGQRVTVTVHAFWQGTAFVTPVIL